MSFYVVKVEYKMCEPRQKCKRGALEQLLRERGPGDLPLLCSKSYAM